MSPVPAFTFAVVCEAAADLRLAADLADRVLCREVEWLEPEGLEALRRWRGWREGDTHLEWHWVPKLARGLNLKSHGHFRGEPGALDAAMARKALLILAQARPVPDAVVLVRDTDGRGDRMRGLEQARSAHPWKFPVVLAVAHTKRECWILAGFDPQTQVEEAALAELRRELGFDPRQRAEDLTAAEPHARRNAKRVLDRLLAGRQDREEDCWKLCELPVLMERGQSTGLAAYLEEVRSRLVPLVLGT